MRMSDLIDVLGGRWQHFHMDLEIDSLEIDTRKPAVRAEALFFALQGATRDGHEFIPAAYEKGVRNFVVSKPTSLPPDANVLLVPDVKNALQQIAKWKRRNFSIPVIAITGSNGKTIVKEWLSWLLSARYQVTKSPKSFNSQVGVPLSVWELNQQSEVGVFEAGISTTGEMALLEQIICPTLGLITNIGEAHAAGFKDRDHKLAEKLILFGRCERVFFCKDQPEVAAACQRQFTEKCFSWSISNPTADLFFRKSQGVFFTEYKGQTFSFQLPFENAHDLENLFHAVALAIFLGLSQDELNQGLAQMKPVAMRLELKRGTNQVYILDDTYNNDLAGLKIALEYMQRQPHRERTTVILSDILQTGKSEESLYQEVNRLLESFKIDRLIGVGEALFRSKAQFSMEASFFAGTDALLKSLPAFSSEMVLVKGARAFALERVVAVLEEKSHGTVLEINMESLIHNLKIYRAQLKPTTKIMVMVKAFAYGGGLSEIAHLLQFHQVDYLGVAYLDEGIQLRRSGITIPIMVMNPEWDHFSLLRDFNLEPEIYSPAMLERYVTEVTEPMGIHLKIETGMNRLGFDASQLESALSVIKQSGVEIKGVFTHFSSSDNPEEDEFTRLQASRFEMAYQQIVQTMGYNPMRHVLNSSGISRWPQFQFEMVRLGIGLYGYDAAAGEMPLKRVSTLKATISQIKEVNEGDTIGYNRMGKVQKPSRIATLSIGYADGYLRAFSKGKAYVTIQGQKASTVGNVCMDMVMVDVTGIPTREGDEAIIFGDDPDISLLAEWAGTIPYEILTSVGQRVKRVFVSE